MKTFSQKLGTAFLGLLSGLAICAALAFSVAYTVGEDHGSTVVSITPLVVISCAIMGWKADSLTPKKKSPSTKSPRKKITIPNKEIWTEFLRWFGTGAFLCGLGAIIFPAIIFHLIFPDMWEDEPTRSFILCLLMGSGWIGLYFSCAEKLGK